MSEKYVRATAAAIIAACGPIIAADMPDDSWAVVKLSAGIVVAALTAFVSFLSRYSGLNEPIK